MPDTSSPVFVYQLLLVILAAANVLGALGTFIASVRGKPTVPKEEFEKYQAYVSSRFDGTNKKVDDLDTTVSSELKSLTSSLSHINADLQRVVGRLEGQINTDKNGRPK